LGCGAAHWAGRARRRVGHFSAGQGTATALHCTALHCTAHICLVRPIGCSAHLTVLAFSPKEANKFQNICLPFPSQNICFPWMDILCLKITLIFFGDPGVLLQKNHA
jgi:hypothetical protein